MNPILASLYSAIPTFECKPGCTDCCGPVPFSRAEWQAVKVKKHHRRGCLDCPYSKGGACEIYEQRPFICRLFGATEDPKLACPHGCKPEKPLAVAEADALTRRYLVFQSRR